MNDGTGGGTKQFKVELEEGLFELVEQTRIARGLAAGELLSQAISQYVATKELEAWSGYGLHKPEGAPWPPKPSTADNRKGGPGQALPAARATTARMPAPLWTRWTGYLYWTRAHNRLESEAAVIAWLALQGVPYHAARPEVPRAVAKADA